MQGLPPPNPRFFPRGCCPRTPASFPGATAPGPRFFPRGYRKGSRRGCNGATGGFLFFLQPVAALPVGAHTRPVALQRSSMVVNRYQRVPQGGRGPLVPMDDHGRPVAALPVGGERGGLLSSLGGVVIRIRILMYPACIMQDTRILMYLDVSQTYLACSVTFQENTCILIFFMYFTRIPKESRIHLGYTSDTSRYMYLMRFLDVTLYQDTCILDASSRYIKIHRDTNHDTCILDAT
jgi:hypothetical protein